MNANRNIGLLVAVAGMAMSAVAVAQPTCCVQPKIFHAFCSSRMEWSAQCSGNTTGSMSAFAASYGLTDDQGWGSCSAPHDDVWSQIVASSDVDDATTTCPSGSLSIDTGVSSDAYSRKSAGCCTGGYSETGQGTEWNWGERWTLDRPCGSELPAGKQLSKTIGVGVGGLSVDFQGGSYTSFLPRVRVQAGYEFWDGGVDCCESWYGEEPEALRSLYYTRIRMVGYPYGGGDPEEEVHTGLFALTSDVPSSSISFVRLGFATNSVFNPTSGSTWDHDVNASGTWINLGGTLPSTLSRFIIEVKEDSFYTFDGNIDGSEYVDDVGPTYCWTDRLELAAARGAQIGDADYNPRADYDLDGTVESSDVAAIVDILGAVDGNGDLVRCLSFDFNCDGFLNASDYDDFAEAFDNADPLADTNCDGFVNGNDYDDFVDGWDLGCP